MKNCGVFFLNALVTTTTHTKFLPFPLSLSGLYPVFEALDAENTFFVLQLSSEDVCSILQIPSE